MVVSVTGSTGVAMVLGEACCVNVLVLENMESMVVVVELIEPPVNLLADRYTAVSPPVLHGSNTHTQGTISQSIAVA